METEEDPNVNVDENRKRLHHSNHFFNNGEDIISNSSHHNHEEEVGTIPSTSTNRAMKRPRLLLTHQDTTLDSSPVANPFQKPPIAMLYVREELFGDDTNTTNNEESADSNNPNNAAKTRWLLQSRSSSLTDMSDSSEHYRSSSASTALHHNVYLSEGVSDAATASTSIDDPMDAINSLASRLDNWSLTRMRGASNTKEFRAKSRAAKRDVMKALMGKGGSSVSESMDTAKT